MLNEESRKRLENLCEMMGTEQWDANTWEVQETKWLIETLSWVLQRYDEHVDCCISPCADAEIIKALKLEIDQLKGNA